MCFLSNSEFAQCNRPVFILSLFSIWLNLVAFFFRRSGPNHICYGPRVRTRLVSRHHNFWIVSFRMQFNAISFCATTTERMFGHLCRCAWPSLSSFLSFLFSSFPSFHGHFWHTLNHRPCPITNPRLNSFCVRLSLSRLHPTFSESQIKMHFPFWPTEKNNNCIFKLIHAFFVLFFMHFYRCSRHNLISILYKIEFFDFKQNIFSVDFTFSNRAIFFSRLAISFHVTCRRFIRPFPEPKQRL